MQIVFNKIYLEELYIDGRTINKKYRFQPELIAKYIQTIDKLRAAEGTEDLYKIKSLNYKKLSGTKKGIESVRVNNKYRLEFISSMQENEIRCLTICSILELSNHYQ
jgi:proteic killer suppression protein